MSDYRRTSVNLPKRLLKDAQLYAVEYGTTVTELMTEGLATRINKATTSPKRSILELAGTLNLGGQEPPSRQQLYDELMYEKMGT